jgi:hypothetical protein
MAQPFDIFRIVPEGGVRWVGAVQDLETARALVKAEQPGDFLVVSIDTGWKMEIKAPAASGTAT